MKAKLTLNLDEEKIKKIKAYTKKNGYSVSKFVEDSIDKLDDKPNPKNF